MFTKSISITLFFSCAISGLAISTSIQASPVSPSFVEEGAKAGIVHSYDGGPEFFVGGGVASFDCNADGKPELFMAGGTSPASLFLNQSAAGGEFQFDRIGSGLSQAESLNVVGAYPADLDNDGTPDLIVLRRGENIILQGQGDCSFERANEEFAFDGGDAWSTGAAVTFEAGSKFPTIAIGNYIDETQEGAPFETCHANRLVRASNASDGIPQFTDVNMLEPGYCALSIMFTDWNNNGQFDLRFSNDRQYHVTGEEQLWNINSDGEGNPSLYGRDDNWEKLVIWGMGIAEGDLDADGRPEYALTSMMDTKIQQLDTSKSGPAYKDIAYGLRATAQRPYTGDNSKPSTGWHSQFADVNNDAKLDLYIAKGNVHLMPKFAAYDPDNLLLGNGDAPMVEAGKTSGINIDARGRGAIIEDLNADGLLDLVVVNREVPATVFRNQSAKLPTAFRISLDGGAGNSTAVGTKLKLTLPNGDIQRRTVAIGGGHVSGQIGPQHFGSAGFDSADLEIKWPDGTVQNQTITAGTIINISKP